MVASAVGRTLPFGSRFFSLIRQPQAQLEVRIHSRAVREEHERPANILHAELISFESDSDELWGQEFLVGVDYDNVASWVRTALQLQIPLIFREHAIRGARQKSRLVPFLPIRGALSFASPYRVSAYQCIQRFTIRWIVAPPARQKAGEEGFATTGQ